MQRSRKKTIYNIPGILGYSSFLFYIRRITLNDNTRIINEFPYNLLDFCSILYHCKLSGVRLKQLWCLMRSVNSYYLIFEPCWKENIRTPINQNSLIYSLDFLVDDLLVLRDDKVSVVWLGKKHSLHWNTFNRIPLLKIVLCFCVYFVF